MARNRENRPDDTGTPITGDAGPLPEPVTGEPGPLPTGEPTGDHVTLEDVNIDPVTGVIDAAPDTTPGVAPPQNPLDANNAAVIAYDEDLHRRHDERRRDGLSRRELEAEDAARDAERRAAGEG